MKAIWEHGFEDGRGLTVAPLLSGVNVRCGSSQRQDARGQHFEFRGHELDRAQSVITTQSHSGVMKHVVQHKHVYVVRWRSLHTDVIDIACMSQHAWHDALRQQSAIDV